MVVAIIGVLAKKQMGAAWRRRAASGRGTPTGTPQQQVQQFKQAVRARCSRRAHARRHK